MNKTWTRMMMTGVILSGLLLAGNGWAGGNHGNRNDRGNDRDLQSTWVQDDLCMFAQAPGGPPEGMPPFRRGGGRFGKQMKHLEQLRMLKMLELLDLEEDQEVEFLTFFNRMRSDQRDREEQINALVDSIALQVESDSPDVGELNRLADRSIKLEDEKHEKFIEFLAEARRILTPEQFGKLVVFHKRFESEILERLGRFREERTGDPVGPMEPGDMPPGEG